MWHSTAVQPDVSSADASRLVATSSSGVEVATSSSSRPNEHRRCRCAATGVFESTLGLRLDKSWAVACSGVVDEADKRDADAERLTPGGVSDSARCRRLELDDLIFAAESDMDARLLAHRARTSRFALSIDVSRF